VIGRGRRGGGEEDGVNGREEAEKSGKEKRVERNQDVSHENCRKDLRPTKPGE
jgi:hypothetical protein